MLITFEQIKALQTKHCKPSSLPTFVSERETQLPSSIDTEKLDSCPPAAKTDLSRLLASLPDKIIQDEFGLDVLTFTWLYFNNSAGDEDRRNELNQYVAKIKSMDPVLLERSRQAVSMLHSSQDEKTILRTYYLIKELPEVIARSINLPSFLKACTNQGLILSDKRTREYSLELLSTDETNARGWESKWNDENDDLTEGDKMFEIYIDAPVGICLLYKGVPNALITFSPKNPVIMLTPQIQGIQGSRVNKDLICEKRINSRGLTVLDWERLLVSIFEKISRELEYTHTGIQSVCNNQWTRDEFRIPLERSLKRYDGTAERLGYKQEKDKNWYKQL